MIKIGQFQAYEQISETDGAVFIHPDGQQDQARLIKMRVITENGVSLLLEPLSADFESGEIEDARFLARLESGMDTIEFFYRGDFRLTPQGGNIWLDTYDNTGFNVESLSPESFARLWEREERDPRILEIERAARHNQERLRAQMESDFIRHAALMEQRYASAVTTPPAPTEPPTTGAPAASTSVPPASDSQSPAPSEDGTGGDA